MVTFRLIEETGQYLTYWYFPNGNEDEMYGIILIDKLNETVEIQKMAHDDFSHIVTVDEQNELRNSINETRKEEGLPLLTKKNGLQQQLRLQKLFLQIMLSVKS